MLRKINRLTKENYHKENIYYLTICCDKRSRYFIHDSAVNLCLKSIKELHARFNAKLWVYCFMPDHLHLLLETENCREIIKLFKQKSGFYFKKQNNANLWQKSYYDHILRKDEDLPMTAAYILNNPVRANLVSRYLDYPYSGSFEVDIKDFMED